MTVATPGPGGSAVIAVLNALRTGRHGLAGRDALALLLVADRAGKLDGECTAALPTLAATAGLSRSSVQRAVAALVAAGWLTREVRGREQPDRLRIGPALMKCLSETSQPEMSQPEMSQPERKRSQPDRGSSQPETASGVNLRQEALRISAPSSSPASAPSSSGAVAPGEGGPIVAESSADNGHGNGAAKEPPIVAEVVSWSREACDDWIARFGGTAPGGRIGAALAPLVKAHGWPSVREAWRSYLAQTDAQYASPQRFAATFGRWAGTHEQERYRDAALRAGIEGGMKRETVADRSRRVLSEYRRPGEPASKRTQMVERSRDVLMDFLHKESEA